VVISLAVTEVALWGYRQQRRAFRRSGYLEGVLGAARAVAEGDVPPEAVIDVVAREIALVLEADSCRYHGSCLPRDATHARTPALARAGRSSCS
jgi:hypothetical protein